MSIKVLILVSMKGRNNFNLREENTNRGNLEELHVVIKSSSGAISKAQQRMETRVSLNPKTGVTFAGSPKVSNSSPLVSPSTTINVSRELYSIDVVATFGVPLTTVGDLHKLINDLKAGKHYELLSEMTNNDCMETLDALEVVLEGGPWLIRKSLIILKKWSMGTRLLRYGLNCMMFLFKFLKRMGRSSFARCLNEVNSETDLVDVVTIGIPSLYGNGFTKETICVEYE
nr:hypothetical protein [Tanacetum cinerariifolium]